MPGCVGPGVIALPGKSTRWTTAFVPVGLGAPSTQPRVCRFVSRPLSKSQALPVCIPQEKQRARGPPSLCPRVTARSDPQTHSFHGDLKNILDDCPSLGKHSHHAEEDRTQIRRHFLSPRDRLIISCFHRDEGSDTPVNRPLPVLLASPLCFQK